MAIRSVLETGTRRVLLPQSDAERICPHQIQTGCLSGLRTDAKSPTVRT